MDDSDDHAAIARGHKAEREWDETSAAFEKVRAAALAALVNTKAGEEAVRERLVITCQILDAVRSALLDVINTGKLAEHAIQQRDLLRR